tara:strand:- start:484 stop:1062 length:579 start_codon:yes stop_codon:yes gene_type:complete
MKQEFNSDKDDAGDKGEAPLKFSLALAGGLLAIVFGLNFLKSPEIPIEYEKFVRLHEDGLIEHILITPFGLSCRLSQLVQLIQEDREVEADRVVLLGDYDIPPEYVGNWRFSGIAVDYQDSEEMSWREWAGIGFLALLFILGIWHIWSQIQKDRKGIGSPRRRLKELEKDFKEGKISLEDYEKAKEKIWAEL